MIKEQIRHNKHAATHTINSSSKLDSTRTGTKKDACAIKQLKYGGIGSLETAVFHFIQREITSRAGTEN